MFRPLRTTLLAGSLAIVAPACSTFTNTNVVADVAGDDITTDRYREMSEVYFERSDAFGTEPPVQGAVSAEASRFLLAAMINQQLFRTFLAREGVDPSGDRMAFKQEVLPTSALNDLNLNDEFIDLIADIDDGVRTQAFSRVQAPNIDDLQIDYERNPNSIGVTCVRHILVETKAEADTIRAELDDGADFAALAQARSIDPSAAEAGGAIADIGNECLPLETVVRGFDPEFARGVLDATVGVPSAPVESSFGWHVILHRPWDEVADSVGRLHQPGTSGKLLFDGFAATADVEIDARYGTWDSLTGAVQPIG